MTTDTAVNFQTHEEENEEERLVGGGKTMSFLDHLDELRQRVIKSLVGVVLCFFLCLGYSTELIRFFEAPLREVLTESAHTLHFTGPLDVFLTSIRMSVLAAIVMSCPVWLFQFWKFFEPALYQRERRYILPFVLASVLLFFAGIAFSYYGILPIALEFLIELGAEVGQPIITITDYTSMLTLMLFGFGFVFEVPLILILFGFLGLVEASTLRKYRRFVCVGVLVVGAILTPPDPLSQIGMAIPLYLMYEISILVIALIQKKRSS